VSRTDDGSYSVGTRRKAMIDRSQVDRCHKVLDSEHATNFESRMVAEVNLYWILYENCCSSQVDLPKTQSALHAWKREWKSVLGKIAPVLAPSPCLS
jgi:hypothetical protein